jgi:glutaconate CoA-transferase subunit A
MARASRFTVVTVEEVDDRPIDRGPGFIPVIYIGAVVVAPGGARPGACPGYYDRDEAELKAYCELARTEAGFAEYLDRYVFAGAGR